MLPPTGFQSMLPPAMFNPERLNVLTFNSLEAELARIRDECDITIVGHFMRNSTVLAQGGATFVAAFLDRCTNQGFQAIIGFEDRPIDNGSGSGDWDISDYTDFFVPNIGHAALFGIASIDEPYEVTTTTRLQVLIAQLKAAFLYRYPIYTNFSGGIELYGNPFNNQYSVNRLYATGCGDIIGITNLPFNNSAAPPLYGKEVLWRRISFSRRAVRVAHETAGTPVPPIYSAIQGFGGVGQTRMPDPTEMLDSLALQLSPTAYGFGPLDRIMFQRWHQRTVGGSDTVLRDTAAAPHREFIKILSSRLAA